jgi:hypothetical protein
MLGKVLNINPTSDYQGNRKRYGKDGALKTVFRSFNKNNDTSDISAASNFLRKTNWIINQLNQNEETLQLDFMMEEFRIKVEIDLRELKSLKRLLYTVHQMIDDEKIKNSFVALVSVDIIEKPIFGYEPQFKLDTMRIFFDRIDELKINSEITRYDSSLINILLDGIVHNLYGEFRLLNFAIIELIRVLTAQEILVEPITEEVYQSISIEKIYSLRIVSATS